MLLLLWLACDVHLEVKDSPPPFALEPGFVEAVPETPIHVVIDDAAPTDELALDIVRIGPLGKGRAKLTVTIDGHKRPLVVVAPTVAERKVGKMFASLPSHQRVPLPTGSARVEIKVDEPMGVKIGVEPAPPPGAIPLAPLEGAPTTPPPPDAAPVTASEVPVVVPPVVAPVAPPVAPVATPDVAPVPAASPAVTAVTPTPKVDAAPPYPKIAFEVRAGGSAIANGLQTLVPAGGVRLLVGPRSIDAMLGFAVDFDGQTSFLQQGQWNAATTRLRLEGTLGLGWVGFFDAGLDVAGGAGLRFTWHSAHGRGVSKDVLAIGGTARVAPELSFEAGPGRFTIAAPVDVGADLSPDVANFAPFAVGLSLGYRLEI